MHTWPVMIAAGAAILRPNLAGGQSCAWMFAFARLAVSGIVILEVLAWRSPESAVERLERLRSYISDHRDSVIDRTSLFGGLWLVIPALIALV